MPFLEAFEIFFEEVPAPRQKEDRATLAMVRTRPIDTAQIMSVRGLPLAFHSLDRDDAAIDRIAVLQCQRFGNGKPP